MKTRWAIFSLWDKTGAVELAQTIVNYGYQILATSRTAQVLSTGGVDVTEVSQWTGAPEILGGRVKTIHPKIAAGILSLRQDESVEPIDLVVCNLYPFADGIKQGCSLKELIELIDIGGVTLLRAAAKNWFFVTPVPAPQYYQLIVEEFKRNGEVSPLKRLELARITFELTGSYDRLIANYFAEIVDKYPSIDV